MNYLYYDYQTGEYFYVNAEHKDGADRIAYFYFSEPEFICIDDDDSDKDICEDCKNKEKSNK